MTSRTAQPIAPSRNEAQLALLLRAADARNAAWSPPVHRMMGSLSNVADRDAGRRRRVFGAEVDGFSRHFPGVASRWVRPRRHYWLERVYVGNKKLQALLAIMAQKIREPVTQGNDSAAVIPDPPLIVEEHPLFPQWLAAFEHLVKAHARVKGGGGAPLTPELQKEFAAAKAAYLELATKLD